MQTELETDTEYRYLHEVRLSMEPDFWFAEKQEILLQVCRGGHWPPEDISKWLDIIIGIDAIFRRILNIFQHTERAATGCPYRFL